MVKTHAILISIIGALLFVSCSESEMNPIQASAKYDLTAVGSKVNSTGSEQLTAVGVFSNFGVNADGKMECIMESEVSEMGSSAFELGAYSGGDGASVSSHKQGNGSAKIVVTYVGFTPEAQAAFQSAVDIWAENIDSDVDIYVLAQFAPLDTGVLGSAGPTFIINNFPGAQRDTWYGNALADKLAGEDLIPGYFDIVANFSSAFPNWYFGTDGNPPAGDFDFRTVVLHELGHGLNFFGGMTYNSGMGSYGFGLSPAMPTIFDQFAITRPGRQLVKTNKFPNPSTTLGDALVGEQILFSSDNTISTTEGANAVLYTPTNWRPGSSYSHLDENIYSGTEDGLMTPALARGEAYSQPGPLVLAMFDDMGWNGKINKPALILRTN